MRPSTVPTEPNRTPEKFSVVNTHSVDVLGLPIHFFTGAPYTRKDNKGENDLFERDTQICQICSGSLVWSAKMGTTLFMRWMNMTFRNDNILLLFSHGKFASGFQYPAYS